MLFRRRQSCFLASIFTVGHPVPKRMHRIRLAHPALAQHPVDVPHWWFGDLLVSKNVIEQQHLWQPWSIDCRRRDFGTWVYPRGLTAFIFILRLVGRRLGTRGL